MASIAFTVIGNAIFPGAGGIIGGLVGSIVDSLFLFPALFGKQTVQGPRLEDLQGTQGAEGSPMTWGIGPRVPSGGVVIWQEDLIEVKTTKRVGKGGGGQRVSNYTYFADFAIGIAETEHLPGPIGRLLKVFADTKVIYDVNNGGDTDKYEEMVFYDGSQTTPDPLIESYRGAGNVPANINLAYIRFKRLALVDFGNRIPNITAIFEQANEMTVGDAITLCCKRAGLADHQIDASAVTTCFKGYGVQGIQDGTRTISPLTLAYGVTVQDVGGVATFFLKGDETPIDVRAVDLAAHEEGRDAPRPLLIKDVDDFDVPSSVVVRYNDVDRDLEQGEQTAHRWNHPSGSPQPLDFPLTLDGVDALTIAKRVLFSTEAERRSVQLPLPPRYVFVREGDALTVPTDSRTHTVWVKQVTRGANHLVEINGTLYQPATYSQTASVDEVEDDEGILPYRAPEELYTVIADLPALQNDQAEKVGLYHFACAAVYTDQWNGAALLRSRTDVAANFVEIDEVPLEAVIGQTLSPVADGPTTFFDTRTEILVRVYEGGLESVSEDECIAGANRAAIQTTDGWEIIGFVNAELIGTRQYKLSMLLRGLRNTEAYTSRHAAGGERFVLLDEATANFADLGLAAKNTNDYYRVVPIEGSVADYPSTRARVTGQTQRPFAPVHVTGEWDDSGNFTLNWTRRSRYIVAPFEEAPMAPDELPERYEVDFVYGPGDGAVIRTVQVDEATTTTYTAADQSADAIDAGVTIIPGSTPWHVRIYQISRTVGRGNPADVVIYP